jgi:predicted AlkP superfamily phosphohydrolase/phosphomutase
VLPGKSGAFTFLSPPTPRRAFWHLAGDQGLFSVIVAVPNLTIDRPFDGPMVGDWTKSGDDEFARPEALQPALLRAGYRPELLNVRNTEYFKNHMRLRTRVARELLDRSGWDLAFVVYEYTDTVAHRYELHCDEWNEVYRAVDRELGSLLESAGRDTTVLLVSDHGWRRYPRSLNLNAWLEENDFEGWRAGMARAGTVSSITGRNVRQGMPPREPLSPGPAELEDLRQRLGVEQHPTTGERVVTRMRTPREVFAGPLSDRAPGRLFVEFLPDLRVEQGVREPPVYSDEPADHHSVDGIYLLAGPGIEAGRGEERSVLDVAPTVLRFFGIAAPEDFDGEAMDDFGRLANLKAPGPLYFAKGGSADSDDSKISPELEEPLRALGYIE